MKIIGLTGKARSGKDTAATAILEWCGNNGLLAERLAFADPLKVSAARALGLSLSAEACVEFCNSLKTSGSITITRDLDDLQAEYSISGREFLQWYGTESHRDVFGSDFWVEVTEKKLAERAGTELDVVVLTDCRFPNEAAMVHKHDGEVWEIDRPDNPDALAGGLEAHSSEVGLDDDDVELVIANVGDIDDLRAMIRSACESTIDRRDS